jgi:hypothetical protein
MLFPGTSEQRLMPVDAAAVVLSGQTATVFDRKVGEDELTPIGNRYLLY